MFYGAAVSAMKPRENMLSLSMEEICLELAQSDSYRVASAIANRLMHRTGSDAIKHTTFKYRTVSAGKSIALAYESTANTILEGYDINPTAGLITEKSSVPESVTKPSLPETCDVPGVKAFIDKYNEEKKDREQITNAESVRKVEKSSDRCCYVSIDEIGVKHQIESRDSGAVKDRKYVENTVIHIQYGEGQYTLTAVGMRNAFILLMSFLLANGLMEDKRLVFLSDGARCIKDYVHEFFGFREYTLILDWLHLKKKCKEYMSMGVKAKDKDAKNEIIRDLLRILWAGNTDDAIAYLSGLKQENVKSKKSLDDLIAYLERKKPYIHCYALRSLMGLRTSSNTVEKANDVNVAQRQKHNGMSWSKDGSRALAAITVAKHNNELHNWIYSHQIVFKLVA